MPEVVALVGPDIVVVAPVMDRAVVTVPQSEFVTIAGSQGPQGIQGLPGPTGGSVDTLTAGAALGGQRMVVRDSAGKAQYASNGTPLHALTLFGMTLGAAALDAPISVQRSGEVTEGSWNWTLGLPVYLGANGLITQTPPSTGFMRIVAFPMSPTSLYLSLREPIALS